MSVRKFKRWFGVIAVVSIVLFVISIPAFATPDGTIKRGLPSEQVEVAVTGNQSSNVATWSFVRHDVMFANESAEIVFTAETRGFNPYAGENPDGIPVTFYTYISDPFVQVGTTSLFVGNESNRAQSSIELNLSSEARSNMQGPIQDQIYVAAVAGEGEPPDSQATEIGSISFYQPVWERTRVRIALVSLGVAVITGIASWPYPRRWLGSALAGIRKALSESGEVASNPLENEPRWTPTKIHSRFDPYEFEELLTQVWERKGYSANTTRKSGDFGLDVVATNGEETLGIQAKRYQPNSSVGVRDVRDTIGAATQRNCDAAVVVTTARFTEPAKQTAHKTNLNNGLRVELVNGSSLSAFINEHSEPISDSGNDGRKIQMS